MNKSLLLVPLLIVWTTQLDSMATFTAANTVIAGAAVISMQTVHGGEDRAAELNYINHCIQKANEKKHREEIRSEFRKQAKKITVSTNEQGKVLSELYKSIDPQAKDDFIKHEVDNYLSPCGCCYPAPSKVCTIL